MTRVTQEASALSDTNHAVIKGSPPGLTQNTALFVSKNHSAAAGASSRSTRSRIPAAALLLSLSLLQGCILNDLNTDYSDPTRTTSTNTATPTATTGDEPADDAVTVRLLRVSISSAATPIVQVFADAANTPKKISDYCSAGSSANAARACRCRFRWNEVNTTSGTAVSIQRKIETAVTQAGDYVATCSAPSVYSTEIESGTQLRITLVPSVTTSALITNTISYLKGNDPTQAADFRDIMGRAYLNVHRYSCYELNNKGGKITNKKNSARNNDTGKSKEYLLATHFCTGEEGAGGTSDCAVSSSAESSDPSPSSQSYYYSLFLPSSNLGGFNQRNSRYFCPVVKEGLAGSASANFGRPYPLDATFALAGDYSPDTPIAVEGPSLLAGPDPASGDQSCQVPGAASPAAAAAAGGGGSYTSISRRCMGWGMRPNDNGTCPMITDSNNRQLPTYRLRRYWAIYPPSFKATGEVIEQPPGVDTVYILDRPVNSGDPAKPYTMLGPKPCPFAYYDKAGVTATQVSSIGAVIPATSVPYWIDSTTPNLAPAYVGTNNSSWLDKSVDNIFFPNKDSDKNKSCAATLPLISYTDTGTARSVSLGTTHSTNTHSVSVGGGRSFNLQKVYVRPLTPWAPHYEEDTTFEACAPAAAPYQDPPLHFAKDSNGQVTWCAEIYPSQNQEIEKLEQRQATDPATTKYNYIKNFTSHVSKNSSSAACNASIPDSKIPTGYPLPSSAACDNASRANYTSSAAYHPNYLLVDCSADGSFSTSSACSSGSNLCASSTCDRTALTTADEWVGYPLLANPQDTEAALRADPSYGCTITWDNNGAKAGKTSPATGCCDPNRVQVRTISGGSDYGTAHLEPDVACGQPTY